VLADEMERSGATKEQIDVLKMIPVPTHNQKNRSTLMLEWSGDAEIEADGLIDIVERNLSSPTYEILKRKGEAAVVLDAHRRPKFVEDIVRDIIDDVLTTHPELPDDVSIRVCSVSEESIHKHDAFAERTSTLGELRTGSRHMKENV
jgi:GTP cyclohydrolase-4